MRDAARRSARVPLTPEDLAFWYADQPRQRTTMAMLMLLDRRPDAERLRAAVARAVEAVPRLRVVDAPFDIALPRWEDDPTFDLDFHVRRYRLPADVRQRDALEGLFHTVGPIYERPFDRTRPLWELIELESPGGHAAVFFRLHHAVADGVGGNTILAALTDGEREGTLPPAPHKAPGAWPEPEGWSRLLGAVGRRLGEDAQRGRALAGLAWDTLRDPRRLWDAGRIAGSFVQDSSYRSRSNLRDFGRSRHLSGLELDFEPLRDAKRRLGGRMVDVLLTGVAGAMGEWHRAQGHGGVEELLTLVPINLRPLEEQNERAGLGNRASAIIVRLPIREEDPRRRFRQIRERVEARKRHPATRAAPALADALATLPRWLYRALAYRSSNAIELIVTNVPGIPVARYLAGAEILAGYPFAPVAPHCPVSVALYGYRGRLGIGLDADPTAMPDADAFRGMLARSFGELVAAAGAGP
jgi:diacylglycerol O-acyltransferase